MTHICFHLSIKCFLWSKLRKFHDFLDFGVSLRSDNDIYIIIIIYFRAAGAFSKSAKYTIVDFWVSATIFEQFLSQNLWPERGDPEPELEFGAAELGSGVLGRCGEGMERSFWRVGFDVLPQHVGKEEAFSAWRTAKMRQSSANGVKLSRFSHSCHVCTPIQGR